MKNIFILAVLIVSTNALAQKPEWYDQALIKSQQAKAAHVSESDVDIVKFDATQSYTLSGEIQTPEGSYYFSNVKITDSNRAGTSLLIKATNSSLAPCKYTVKAYVYNFKGVTDQGTYARLTVYDQANQVVAQDDALITGDHLYTGAK